MDEFTTEIGGDVYVKKNGLYGMFGVTNGMIKGSVDYIYAVNNPDGKLHKSPSILLKAGFDRKITDNFRLRLCVSYYETKAVEATPYLEQIEQGLITNLYGGRFSKSN